MGAKVPLVKIKTNFQITIPQSIRQKINVNIGDYLEVKDEGGRIVVCPVKIVSSEDKGSNKKTNK